MIRNLTPEEYENEKRRILTAIYNPYNSNNSDEYIPNQQVAKDNIQNRIDFQMLRNYIPTGSKIQEDVYQLTFENLLKLNPKNTKLFVDKYYKNPDSAFHFAYFLLKIKGFAIHPNNPLNHKHSLAKSIVYASGFIAMNKQVNVMETFNAEDNYTNETEVTIIDDG